eukprot:SAG25_NODE_835_length_5135_cov_3.455719_3_plen_46_part_00
MLQYWLGTCGCCLPIGHDPIRTEAAAAEIPLRFYAACAASPLIMI